MVLFSSFCLETVTGKTFKYIDNCLQILFLYKLLTSTSDEYESGFDSDRRERDSQ